MDRKTAVHAGFQPEAKDDARVQPCQDGLLAYLRAGAVLAAAGLVVAPQPLLAAPRAPSFVRSCSIPEPKLPPLFVGGKSSSEGAAKETEEEEGEEANSETPTAGGFIVPGSDICVKVSGTVSAGLQRDAYKASARANATGLVPRDATSFPLSATFRLESVSTLSNGVPVATVFEFEMAGSGSQGETTLTEASMTLGPWMFGLASSRFDFWTGEDFIFVGRIPSRTVGIIAYELALTGEMRMSFALEDTNFGQQAVPAAGRRVPDGIVRLFHENDELTVHGAVALRDVAPIAGSSARLGRAAVFGATWSQDILGRPMTLSGQIAGAIDAPTYIGSRLDRRTVLTLLLPDEASRGWSAVTSLGREWTKTWSTNAYVSRYDLRLPRLGSASNQIRIDRVAGNVVWTPVEGLRAGLEASFAWSKIDLGGRAAGVGLSGRQSSFQAFIERSF